MIHSSRSVSPVQSGSGEYEMKRSIFLIIAFSLVGARSLMESRPVTKEFVPVSSSEFGSVPGVFETKHVTIAPQSIYTELAGPSCSSEKDTGMVTSEHQCPGVGGYNIIVTDVDDRESSKGVTPQKRHFDLGLNSICHASVSSVGEKAEWRVVVDRAGRRTPIALIVRTNCQAQDGTVKITSYLAAAKITQSEICVTAYISPGPNANVRARRAADASPNKPCLQPPNS